MGLITKIMAVVYLLVGFYLLNFQLGLISLDFLKGIEGGIMFVAGVIVLFHGILFFIKRTRRV